MEKILGMAKVSTKGQTTIPNQVRARFQIKIGDNILFVEKDGELILRKA
jgi:AbrB family looped-hinge helix DNA binding protein